LLNEPVWVTPSGVIELNQNLLEQGERHVVRDLPLLESACARPKNLWLYEGQDDVAVLATCLLFAVARNHPFEQGNKRTAFAAMRGFLLANGFNLILSDDLACADSILAVLVGEETEEQFVESLKAVTVRHDLRDWR
jgi:death-on-curing protein